MALIKPILKSLKERRQEALLKIRIDRVCNKLKKWIKYEENNAGFTQIFFKGKPVMSYKTPEYIDVPVVDMKTGKVIQIERIPSDMIPAPWEE